MADQLRAAISTNPLLRSSGPSLDPQTLFHGADGRSRISVINFSGLASDEARLSFVNQLQMALFTWINGFVSNALTHLYGRMSSAATIGATQEIMSA